MVVVMGIVSFLLPAPAPHSTYRTFPHTVIGVVFSLHFCFLVVWGLLASLHLHAASRLARTSLNTALTVLCAHTPQSTTFFGHTAQSSVFSYFS